MHKSKTIKRGCVVCAKKISIKIYPDGYYRNAHYFGVMKIPVKGTGEYKKTGVTKLGMKQVDVVKWTGKENKVEYWECESCYEEAKHENWLEKTIEKLYGKRCPDYERNCACCQAWNIYDTITDYNRGKL